jgi:hypothetical protein
MAKKKTGTKKKKKTNKLHASRLSKKAKKTRSHNPRAKKKRTNKKFR